MKNFEEFVKANEKIIYEVAEKNAVRNKNGDAVISRADPWFYEDEWDKHYKELIVMKKFFALVVLFCTVMISSTAAAARGVVVYYNDYSDKIIIETNMGFTCGEIMGGGYFLDTRHVIVGSLESYGIHEMHDLTSDRSFRIYVDEYWLDADRALEWLGR